VAREVHELDEVSDVREMEFVSLYSEAWLVWLGYLD